MNVKPKVQIFLSTYNGEKYISEQIESLLEQKEVRVSILVRDDGSSDKTIQILNRYQQLGKIVYYQGKNLGYSKSFLNLVGQNVKADYYAFCDQDDVWLPNKLAMAIKWLDTISRDFINQKPVLYTSALQRVDENLNKMDLQEFSHLRLTLGAEFTRHRLAGCSFVFNESLRSLLKQSSHIDDLTCSHDKLATILCIACGGKILFDHNSYILFRRHGSNASGDGLKIKEKFQKELKFFFNGCSNAAQLSHQILQEYKEELDGRSYEFLKLVETYKDSYIKTLKLALSSQINCGFLFFDLFIRTMIIAHLF